MAPRFMENLWTTGILESNNKCYIVHHAVTQHPERKKIAREIRWKHPQLRIKV